METLLILILIVGVLAGIRDNQKRKKASRDFDSAFLSRCAVADEIEFVEYRAENMVLARCVDGRWGIASDSGWLHLGKGSILRPNGKNTRVSGRTSTFDIFTKATGHAWFRLFQGAPPGTVGQRGVPGDNLALPSGQFLHLKQPLTSRTLTIRYYALS